MKKILFIVPLLFFALSLSSSVAHAKPVVDEFENKSYPLSDVKRALILPIDIAEAVSVPPSEPFFGETLSQRWDELVKNGALDKLFIVKTPEQIVSTDAFITGKDVSGLSKDEVIQKALELAPQYVDAIVTLTVTDAKYGIVKHEGRTNWDVGVGVGWGSGRRNGWGYGVYVPPPVTTQAWDQSYAIGALKVEVRDAKEGEHTLVYGLSVHESVPGGALPGTPSLTKVVGSLLDTAGQTPVGKIDRKTTP